MINAKTIFTERAALKVYVAKINNEIFMKRKLYCGHILRLILISFVKSSLTLIYLTYAFNSA